jgi:hypothetical protein
MIDRELRPHLLFLPADDMSNAKMLVIRLQAARIAVCRAASKLDLRASHRASSFRFHTFRTGSP